MLRFGLIMTRRKTVLMRNFVLYSACLVGYFFTCITGTGTATRGSEAAHAKAAPKREPLSFPNKFPPPLGFAHPSVLFPRNHQNKEKYAQRALAAAFVACYSFICIKKRHPGGILSMQKPTKFGSYIIIPLKYDHESFQEAKLKGKLQVVAVTTMDLNENVKEIFNRSAHAVGTCYGVSRSILCEAFLNAESFTVQDICAALPFQIADSYLGFGCQHKNQHIG